VERGDKVLLSFKDVNIEHGKLDSFIRIIKNQEYIFVFGKLIMKKIVKHPKFLKSMIPNEKIDKKIITMDIETRRYDNDALLFKCI
jgi:hypothetical protein